MAECQCMGCYALKCNGNIALSEQEIGWFKEIHEQEEENKLGLSRRVINHCQENRYPQCQCMSCARQFMLAPEDRAYNQPKFVGHNNKRNKMIEKNDNFCLDPNFRDTSPYRSPDESRRLQQLPIESISKIFILPNQQIGMTVLDQDGQEKKLILNLETHDLDAWIKEVNQEVSQHATVQALSVPDKPGLIISACIFLVDAARVLIEKYVNR